MIFQSLKWDDGASTVNKILSFTDKIFYKIMECALSGTISYAKTSSGS